MDQNQPRTVRAVAAGGLLQDPTHVYQPAGIPDFRIHRRTVTLTKTRPDVSSPTSGRVARHICMCEPTGMEASTPLQAPLFKKRGQGITSNIPAHPLLGGHIVAHLRHTGIIAVADAGGVTVAVLGKHGNA